MSPAKCPLRRCLYGVARLVQFRSELAIVIALAAGIGAGVVARHFLPVSLTPPATFAAPQPSADRHSPSPLATPPAAGGAPARTAADR